jgi:hypothetical protein
MSLSVKRPSRTKENLLQEVTDTGAPKKRLNAQVEATLYRRIKTQAVREDRSISDITRQLWIEYLSKYSHE